MALNDIVRSAVATAESVTSSLLATVSIAAWIGDDGYDAPLFAQPIVHKAIVEQKAMSIRAINGEQVMTRVQITFLHPIAPNGASGRVEPIDPRDRIVLPDGSTGGIVLTQGMVNPATSGPYLLQVSIS